MPKYETLRPEYVELWRSIEVRPEHKSAVDASAKRILSGKAAYQTVEAKTGVPWYVVGLIHMMECGGRTDRHLHNGDPLTKRTTHVPAGRPLRGKPPFTWEESAVDALESHDLHLVKDWSIPRIAFELERYNGWGYRRPGKPASPYLWSKTKHYKAGKYVADGVYSPTAVSGQSGAMALLNLMMALDASIKPDEDGLDEAESFPKATVDREPPKSMATSTTGGAAIANGGLATVPIAQGIGDAIAKTGADGTFSMHELAMNILSSGWFWTGIGMLVFSAYIWIERRKKLITWGV